MSQIAAPSSSAATSTPRAQKGATNTAGRKLQQDSHDLGSNHSNIEITFPCLVALTMKTSELAWVAWDAFRKHSTAKATDTPITDIESWPRDLQSDTQLSTRTIQTDAPTKHMDSQLAHLIESPPSGRSNNSTNESGKRLHYLTRISKNTAESLFNSNGWSFVTL